MQRTPRPYVEEFCVRGWHRQGGAQVGRAGGDAITSGSGQCAREVLSAGRNQASPLERRTQIADATSA
jgi:hypothetical protein